MKLFDFRSRTTFLILLFLSLTISNKSMTIEMPTNLRIATFNVSMEALNYTDKRKPDAANIDKYELSRALKSGHQQIKNIAEVIQRVNPDIILLNEFDRVDDSTTDIH